MQTFTEIVAAVVIHASAVAYSHLGVLVEPQQPERAAQTERKVARSAPPAPDLKTCDAPRSSAPSPEAPLSLGRA
ncbi:hypothetical protein [Phenylobacterium sp.]|uniref:hypothetical protein n=1 Tax=Phenylobacterium sp. TaxID=1871053 RepID=UPI00273096C9|nr:hypothetical protein [Phenylobacterium sp.]MDP1873768.1 hypothetical protein [Phenylobacterium sp.]MDP3489670.1 hypothetical protein [Phenylobacterium sp.]